MHVTGNETIAGNKTFTGTTFGITKVMVGLGNADDTSDASKASSGPIKAALDTKLPSASYTAADVLSKLLTVDTDSSGLNASTLEGHPASYFHTVTFNAASQSAMLALSTAKSGDIAIRTDLTKSFVLQGTYSTLSSWVELPGGSSGTGGAVTSVSGRVGNIILTAADVGLSTIDATTLEGHPASYFAIAGSVGGATTDASALITGTLADARLPSRLGTYCAVITDWNNAITTGFYRGTNATNQPAGNYVNFRGIVIATGATSILQIIHRYLVDADASSGASSFRRTGSNIGGVLTWAEWIPLRESADEQDYLINQKMDDTALAIGLRINGASSKGIILDSDEFAFSDVTFASNPFILRKATFANIKETLANTFASLSGAIFTGVVSLTDNFFVRAVLKDCSQAVVNKGQYDVNSTVVFDYTEGQYQNLVCNSVNIKFKFTNWPAVGRGEFFIRTANIGSGSLTFFSTTQWRKLDGSYTTSFATYLIDRGLSTKTVGVDEFVFWSEDVGTTIIGSLVV